MLEIQKFIKENKNWRQLLSEKPYCLLVKEDERGYLLLKYNQINSDFSNLIVQECRGIILKKDTYEIVCHPFHKFFNWGESQASYIDWSFASALEKIDGSLIKIWYDIDDWNISTNGTINAFEANLENTLDNVNSFGKLFLYTLAKMNIVEEFWKAIDNHKEYSHLFELATPLNRIVVPYKDYGIYYLSSKKNNTGEEDCFEEIYDIVPVPKQFPLYSLDECIKSAEKLPYDNEGYVVVDKYRNRIKIKSPAYVVIHHMKGEGGVSKRRMLDLIRAGEDEEFLNYFPEYEEIYEEVWYKWSKLVNRIVKDIQRYHNEYSNVDRKTLALWATKECLIPAIIFSLKDGKILSWEDYLSNQTSEKLLKYMEKIQ